jgi:para-nitrobenzyl esterase
MKGLAVIAVLLAVLAGSAQARVDNGDPSISALDVVMTTRGPVRGVVTPGARSFLGIPYAAAPIGDLRWRPPRPHAPWARVLDATHFGDHCPQPPNPFGMPGGLEDCLFLNVYAPGSREGDERVPVMVWIHPGGGFGGESDDWNPVTLVRQGVAVVTFNYRLGALGFLAHPALTAESPEHASGNYGLMDMQAVLRWVRSNIARFGGDPDNVTLFGQSAGGYAVRAQLASPAAAGLFHRAIVQTGAWDYRPPQERSPGFPARITDAPLAIAETRGLAFAAAVGCAQQTAACLRAVPVDVVLASQPSVELTIDGKVLTQPIGAAFAAGDFNRVPVIEGTAHDEWRMFVGFDESLNGPLTAAGYPAAIATTFDASPTEVASIASRYPLDGYPSPSIALGAAGTDGALACPSRTDARTLSRRVPVFVYEFNDAQAPPVAFLPPVSFPYGAFHSSELQYLFAPAGPSSLNAHQQRLAETMAGYWTSFARAGRPSSPDGARWHRYSEETEVIQSLNAPQPTATAGFAADHKCRFWASFGR